MFSKKFLLSLYETLYKIRIFESESIKLYRQGYIRGYFHPYLGEEAIAVGVWAALRDRDYITSTHRGHGHCIARGAELKSMVAEIMGKETGYCMGLGGSMHIADVTKGNLGANGIVGGGIALGVGAALGTKIRGDDRVTAVFFSDGASNNGVFPESLNLAGAWNLPVVFVLENNHYAVCTPVEKSSSAKDLYTIGKGYGVESTKVDGNDVVAVYETTKKSVEKCREGKGPVLIEAKTYRHGGHHVNDPGSYMPSKRLNYFKSKDPLKLCRERVLNTAKTAQKDIKKIEQAVEKAMEEAIEFAKQSPDMSKERFFELVENY